jgi:Putative ABC exporter
MNRALMTLLKLNTKAVFRRTLRGVKTWRGAFLLLFTLGFVALMIGPQLYAAVAMRGRLDLREQLSGTFEPLASLGLFGFTLLFVFTSAGETAVYFTPAEVDLLFSAPFTRRELLLYKLAKTALALVFVSAFVSLSMLMNLRSWLSGFVGIMLAMAMMQLVGMITAMAGQIVAESVYTRARKLALLAVTIVAMWGLAQGIGQIEARGLPGALAALREAPAFRVLLAPFEVFTRAMFAEKWFPDLVGWGAGALAIDAALLAILLKLDANYLEMAATISQKVYERIRRAKQGGGVAMPVSARAGRLRLPGLPWLAGAGPVAWRQLLIVLRTSRHLLLVSMAIIGMIAAGLLFSPGPARGPQGTSLAPWFGIGMTFYLTFLFSMQLPWAFRGDLDQIESLKALPVHPAPLAVGELAGGVLVLTAIQFVLFAILTAVEPAGWPLIAAAAAFCVPFNGLMLGLNNLLFLLYPVRHPAGTTFDFQVFGKLMLFFFLQLVLLVPLLGIPAALGGAAYFLAGYSWPAFVVTTWLMLAAELVPLVLAVACAFLRFDVSTQTPA